MAVSAFIGLGDDGSAKGTNGATEVDLMTSLERDRLHRHKCAYNDQTRQINVTDI
jgi:hypothetical protein